MSRGRHCKPNNTARSAKRAGAGAALVALLATQQSSASADVNDPTWGAIVHCESGGQNIENAGPSTASGYFQIIDGTWRGAGGLEFAPRAIDATYDQQLVVAERIRAARGSFADWNASRSCWEPLMSNPPAAPQRTVDATVLEEPVVIDTQSFAGEAREAIRLVNEERAKAGLGQLSVHTCIQTPAEHHSSWMATTGRFEHRGNLQETMQNCQASAIGENIAYGQNSAAEVVQDWMDSPGHRENILNPTFTHVGVGATVDSSGTVWWSQEFVADPQAADVTQEIPVVVEPDPPAVPADGVVEVAPGDTLSEIAIEDLGLPAWQPFYELNRAVVGDNPDLIFPGQTLHFVGGLPLPAAPVSTEVAAAPAEGYANPLPGGTITQDYKPGTHDGIDIGAPQGTPVYAAHSGKVTFSGLGDPGGYGAYVQIEDWDGTVTQYGHVDTWLFNVGDFVFAGEQIATVGNRGDSYGANGGYHLHFRVHIGPGPVNPSIWLRDHGV